MSEELFDKVVGVNLKGPFRLAALVGARMAEGDGGSIINVSSVAAIRPTPIELPYGAAKAGLDALTIGFAQAYGPKVRVNSIQCGPFYTDISEAWDKEQAAKTFATLPARPRRGAARDRRHRPLPRQRRLQLHDGDGAARRRRAGHRPLRSRRAMRVRLPHRPLLADVRRLGARSST